MVKGARILVVEDEPKIADMVAYALGKDGHRCRVALDGPAGLAAFAAEAPDLVVLDLMLPGLDGLAVCRQLRARSAVPILMLTARTGEADKVAGLDGGADDYLTKPFSLAELKARVRALLRRAAPVPAPGGDRAEDPAAPDAPLALGPLAIDPASREVTVGGRPVKLTAKEFDLLWLLARHPGQVFSREQLLAKVWDGAFGGFDRTVDTHVTRLRRKIEADPGAPALLVTVWGVGYKLAVGP